MRIILGRCFYKAEGGMTTRALLGVAIGWLCAVLCAPAPAAGEDAARRAVHLLDYIQVDYIEAVREGAVVSAEEYAEMQEFAAAVAALVDRLEVRGDHATLKRQAHALEALIAARSPRDDVAGAAGTLRDALVETYGVQAAPRALPDLARGAALYEAQCVSCHGSAGLGDGSAGAGLEPPPTDFTDAARAAQRSVLGYYNTITLGVEGTGMASYAALPEADRWALAFHVAGFSATPAERERGAALWDDGARGAFADLGAVTRRAPAELADADERALLAYLRTHPGAITAGEGGPLAHARKALAQSVERYRAGDAAGAYAAALSAYLDGYELIEQSLAGRDGALALDIERHMLAYREDLKTGGEVAAVEGAHRELVTLLERAGDELAQGGLSPALAFTSAFVILLREGLEAVLVLAAIVAFLRRAQRQDALRYVHAGWIAAVAAGLATAAAAVWVVNISGATRELTEGFSALLAAGVLFYMGYWMHDKAHAQRWQAYIGERLSGALGSGTVWALAAVSFLAVYRELFETILFYQALWLQTAAAARPALIGGVGAGALALVVATVAVLRVSGRLPLGLFFGASAVFMYALAVVFAGKGVMALQEAGRLPLDVVPIPRIDWLGVYPSAQALAAQALLVALALGHLAWTLRRSALPGASRAAG
jgi:high-affinity iron transporter